MRVEENVLRTALHTWMQSCPHLLPFVGEYAKRGRARKKLGVELGYDAMHQIELNERTKKELADAPPPRKRKRRRQRRHQKAPA